VGLGVGLGVGFLVGLGVGFLVGFGVGLQCDRGYCEAAARAVKRVAMLYDSSSEGGRQAAKKWKLMAFSAAKSWR